MNIVLVEPEIPPNTGNIARTCVLTGTKLHLVEPLGFSLSEKEVRRSGLDYWQYLNLKVYKDFNDFLEHNIEGRLFSYSTGGTVPYSHITYQADDFLVFGSETKGLAAEVLKNSLQILRIPMIEQIPRSLNLGNAVAIVLYEALRQQGFPEMV